MKLWTLITLLAGLATAQPGTFTGTHPTGETCYPDDPNGQTNCYYSGNITGDPNGAEAYLTDTTGVNFPGINPRVTPPTIVNQSGVWNATIPWKNGAGVTGTTTVTGTCVNNGGPIDAYNAEYTVSCVGVDTNGSPASKTTKYLVYKLGGRFGAFWQRPGEAPFNPIMFTAQ